MRVSPDGKWVVYNNGNAELWTASFPAFTDRRRIFAGNARAPIWRADGREIIFDAQPDVLTAVDVKTGATLETGPPRPLFKMPQGSGSSTVFFWTMTNDAQHFLLRSNGGGTEGEVEQLNVILNWPALFAK